MDKSILFSSPIGAIFILEEEGIPLFARAYGEEATKEEIVLIGGFLAAIEGFARNHLQGEITDIGMGSKRYFFKKDSNLIFVVSITLSEKDTYYIDLNLLGIVLSILDTLAMAFTIIYDAAGGKNKEYETLVQTFGDTADSIVLEAITSFQDLSGKEIPDSTTDLIEGKTVELDSSMDVLKEIERTLDTKLSK